MLITVTQLSFFLKKLHNLKRINTNFNINLPICSTYLFHIAIVGLRVCLGQDIIYFFFKENLYFILFWFAILIVYLFTKTCYHELTLSVFTVFFLSKIVIFTSKISTYMFITAFLLFYKLSISYVCIFLLDIISWSDRKMFSLFRSSVLWYVTLYGSTRDIIPPLPLTLQFFLSVFSGPNYS